LVNASLNWASIVGIVLAVGGAFLYFMRNFKPALARDYDVFFAAIGLLCGGILFFQGWRLDPILQFGQFLLAATTVFFAYESVRLRGVTTEQARRSSYFDDEEPAPFAPRGGVGGRSWEGESFDEPDAFRGRIPSREGPEEDFYRPRRPSRAAIPERAASRRPDAGEGWDNPRREPDYRAPAADRDGPPAGRYSAGGSRQAPADFGARRREGGGEVRRGSRPVASADTMPRSSRRPSAPEGAPIGRGPAAAGPGNGVPQGSPIRGGAGDAGPRASGVSDADYAPLGGKANQPTASGSYPSRPPAASRPEASRPASRDNRPGSGGPARDNSSRFDD
jgi:hypothetical protein